MPTDIPSTTVLATSPPVTTTVATTTESINRKNCTNCFESQLSICNNWIILLKYFQQTKSKAIDRQWMIIRRPPTRFMAQAIARNIGTLMERSIKVCSQSKQLPLVAVSPITNIPASTDRDHRYRDNSATFNEDQREKEAFVDTDGNSSNAVHSTTFRHTRLIVACHMVFASVLANR